jgi:hypothetical protein
LDTPSRVAEPFWVAVTGFSLSERRGGGTFATLVPVGGDAFLRVQVVGSAVAGGHVDLHVEDVPAGAAEAVSLGASVVRDDGDLVVLRSPAGVVFCLVPWGGESVRPGGGPSLVDQLCLDVPVGVFEREASFWSGLTGWARGRTDRAEFDFLARGDGMPLRLLLQRIGSGAAGVHVDFACEDVDVEVARHVGLGASVVRRVPGEWTTLRDPAGREYCVTGRSPA